MNGLRSLSRRLALLAPAVSALLGGCAATDPTPVPRLPNVPAAFAEPSESAAQAAAASPADGRWWTLFDDPLLDALIDAGLRANTQLQMAAARVEWAAAQRRAALAAAMPSLGVQLGASRQGGPLINALGDNGQLFRADAQASWEPDLLGRLRRGEAAAAADLASQRAQLSHVRLLVQAEVAQTWLAWRALHHERQQLAALVELWSEQARMAATAGPGAAAVFELASRLRAGQLAAETELQGLDRRSAQLRHLLGYLLGQSMAIPDAPGPMLQGLPRLPAGLPAQVIARRPDVAAALHALQADLGRSAVAADAWFPGLTLTASAGQASADLLTLLGRAARGFGLEMLLSATVFDGGRRDAAREAAAALARQSAARHADVVFAALREVEDQLAALRTLAREADLVAAAEVDLQRLVARAESLHRSGLASRQELLESQRRRLANQRIAAQITAARGQATVSLIRALGGGWAASPAIVAAAPTRAAQAH